MLLATLTVVIFMALIIQWSFDKGFLEYVNIEEQDEISKLAQELERYYDDHGSWDGLKERPYEILGLHAETMPPGKSKHRLHELADEHKYHEWLERTENPPHEGFRHPIERTVILDENGEIFFGHKLNNKLPRLIPLMHNDVQVGSIGLYMPRKIVETNQLMFVEKQNTFILIACFISIFITICMSTIVSYRLTKPVRRLSSAARKLTEGDLTVRVPAGDSNEMDRLSSDFNTLAETLQENDKQRKQWVSEIAHELRTPLTSLKGQIEAIQDGIRVPDERTFDILHKGVNRLERLVNDLYDLSRSDLGTFTLQENIVDLGRLVDSEIGIHQQEADTAGLTLTRSDYSEDVLVYADTQRLLQLLGNLITNSIQYTDKGGAITVSVCKEKDKAVLTFEDSAPGVPNEALPQLFNRLYRVEQSRNRALGGSGLGLAICREIVRAHNGTITANHAEAGGLKITVTLPLFEPDQA